MKYFLITLLALLTFGSFSAFAAEGTICKVVLEEHSNTTSQTYSSSPQTDHFIVMKLEKYPDLVFKASKTGNNALFIGLEVSGKVQLFVTGENQVNLTYHPNKIFQMETIKISCNIQE